MTATFIALIKEKYDNPSKNIDWQIVSWEDWQQILLSYLVQDIELLKKNIKVNNLVEKMANSINRAIIEGYIICEQGYSLIQKYVYTAK